MNKGRHIFGKKTESGLGNAENQKEMKVSIWEYPGEISEYWLDLLKETN